MSDYRYGALYCRISKSEELETQNNSIESQKLLLKRIAQEQGYEKYQYYIDEGCSGADFNRPQFQKLKSDIENGLINAVLVKDLSRLGRDYLQVGYYVEHFFPKHNVRFIAVNSNIDTSTESAQFLPFYSIIDEWYAKDISHKMRVMYDIRATSGIPVGHPVYGYKINPDNPNYWIIDKEASKIVRFIYQLSFQGYGSSQIAQLLEKERVLTPANYKLFIQGRDPTNSSFHWGASTISQILHRQEYCGDVINKKTYSHSFKEPKRHLNPLEDQIIFCNIHDPIIDRNLWEMVQIKRKQNFNKRKARKQSLFSGFLRCSTCGSNMHFHINQSNPDIEYYNCSNYVGNKGTCPQTHYVRMDYLKPVVTYELNAFIKYTNANWELFCKGLAEQKEHEHVENVRICKSEIKKIDIRQQELSKLISQAYEEKINQLIDEETFSVLLLSFKNEKSTLNEKWKYYKCQLQKEENILNGLEYFKTILSIQQPITGLTRELLHQYVNWIGIYPQSKGNQDEPQRIDIHYHYIGCVSRDNFASSDKGRSVLTASEKTTDC